MPTVELAEVIRHEQPWPSLHLLELRAPRIAAEAAPGQFVHVKAAPVAGPGALAVQLPAPSHPLLRRPLSVHDTDASTGTLSLLFKVKGTGTSILASTKAGSVIDILGPMGRGFTLPPAAPSGPYLLVGGGVGVAPLVFLAKALAASAPGPAPAAGPGHVTVLFGAASSGEIEAAMPGLRTAGCRTIVSTLDGSAGARGLVTDILAHCGVEPGFIYACGPEPMMAAVSSYASARGIPGEVSLEEHMACGVGACLGCARELTAPASPERRYAKVCKDGPVFAMGAVLLNAGAGATARPSPAPAPAPEGGGRR